MIAIRRDFDLQPYNTFGLRVKCDLFCEINSINDFLELVRTEQYRANKRLVLGGGSNVLFLGDFHGLVIRNNLRGIEVVSEDKEFVLVKAAAGEVWHDLVL